MDIKITGLEETGRALQKVQREIAVLALGRALDAAAGVIAATVARRLDEYPEVSETPLAEHVITTVSVDVNGAGGRGAIGIDRSIDDRAGVPQDAKAYWLEFGHRLVTHEPGKWEIGEVKPYPFMRPAFEESADHAAEVFAEALKSNLPEGL